MLLQEGTFGGAPVRAGLEGDNWAYFRDQAEGFESRDSNDDFNFEGSSSTSFDMDEDLIVRANK